MFLSICHGCQPSGSHCCSVARHVSWLPALRLTLLQCFQTCVMAASHLAHIAVVFLDMCLGYLPVGSHCCSVFRHVSWLPAYWFTLLQCFHTSVTATSPLAHVVVTFLGMCHGNQSTSSHCRYWIQDWTHHHRRPDETRSHSSYSLSTPPLNCHYADQVTNLASTSSLPNDHYDLCNTLDKSLSSFGLYKKSEPVQTLSMSSLFCGCNIFFSSFNKRGDFFVTGSSDGYVILVDGRPSQKFKSLGYVGQSL